MAVNGEDSNLSEKRIKRIRFLRKVILASIAAACLIPTCICLLLAIKYDRLSGKLDRATEELAWYESKFGESALAEEKGDDKKLADQSDGDDTEQVDDTSDISTEESLDESGAETESGNEEAQPDENAESPETTENADAAESTDDKTEDVLANASGSEPGSDGIRRVYITFDDGPSTNTNNILDILKEYDVKASFFVTGKTDSKYKDVYNRIVSEGHTFGMHSYSHKYSELYESLDSFQTDLNKLRTFLYETTGVWSKYYRFPGGSSNTVSKVDMKELINYLALENITYYDWNVGSGDDRSGITKDLIVTNVMTGVPKFYNSMILLHDASDKQATVEALPEIIEQVQALDNTVIVPIADDTLPVQHINNNSQ